MTELTHEMVVIKQNMHYFVVNHDIMKSANSTAINAGDPASLDVLGRLKTLLLGEVDDDSWNDGRKNNISGRTSLCNCYHTGRFVCNDTYL